MKPLSAAAILAASYQGMPVEELKKFLTALNSVVDLSLAQEYTGDLLQIPMYANTAVSFSLCKEYSEYKKYLQSAIADDILHISDESQHLEVHVCIYRINKDEHVRIAMYIPEVQYAFFVRCIESEAKLKKFINSNYIHAESQFTLRDKSGNEVEVVMYKSHRSEMFRLAMVPPKDVDINFNEDWISNNFSQHNTSDDESATTLF